MATVSVYDVLTDIAKDVNREFNLEVAVPGKSSIRSVVKGWIPTDSTVMNLLFGRPETGDLGVALGRIIEIFGDFSHGKSTILQIIMNAFQAAGGLTNLLDSESGWDEHRAVKMGHNPERHLSIEVDTVEDGFNVINKLNEKYISTFGANRDYNVVPILYGWDTIAASPTAGEKKGDEYESGMMFKARKIRQELRRLAIELPKNNATLVFINQTIEGPKKKTTPGGGGIKFWSSQRFEIRRVGSLHNFEDKKKTAGIISNLKNVKNKLSPPFRNADIPLMFDKGFSPERELLNYHLDNTSIVNVAGARKKILGFGDEDLSFFDKDTQEIFDTNPGLIEYLREEMIKHWTAE